MSHDWTDDEFGWNEVRSELQRIRRRVRARWHVTLLVTIALTGLVVFWQTRRVRMFDATVTLRVVEGGYDPASAPPTSAQLQDYLWEVALSRKRLIEVMEKFNLYASKREIDPLMAVDEIRDVLNVKVVRNYFQTERDPDAPPRSARIALSFSHEDPQTSIEVARFIANLIAEEEASARKRTSEAALESMNMSTSQLENAIVAARREESRLNREMIGARIETAAALALRLTSVRKRIRSLEDQKVAATTVARTLGMRAEVEGQELGLRFEVIDPGRVPQVVVSSTLRLFVLGFMTFIFGLPLAGTAVAAFDLRIYDLEDLRRLGFEPFGHIPAFAGYRHATLNDRLAKRTGAS